MHNTNHNSFKPTYSGFDEDENDEIAEHFIKTAIPRLEIEQINDEDHEEYDEVLRGQKNFQKNFKIIETSFNLSNGKSGQLNISLSLPQQLNETDKEILKKEFDDLISKL